MRLAGFSPLRAGRCRVGPPGRRFGSDLAACLNSFFPGRRGVPGRSGAGWALEVMDGSTSGGGFDRGGCRVGLNLGRLGVVGAG